MTFHEDMKKYTLYQLAARYPKIVFFITGIFTLLALWFSQKLHIESDLSSLLPTQTSSLKNLYEVKKYFGSSGFLYVTVEDEDENTAERFSQSLIQSLEKIPDVSYIDYKRPEDFFEDKLWLYLDLQDLQEIEKRVDKGLSLEA